MIRITIAYPKLEGRVFDHDYLLHRHLPRLFDLVGEALVRATVERGVDAAPWPTAEHEMVCVLECESLAAFEAAFFPYVEDLQDDMECCGGVPTIQVSEVVLERIWRRAGMPTNTGEIYRRRRSASEPTRLAAAR